MCSYRKVPGYIRSGAPLGHKNKISLHSDLPKEIHVCPQCVWSHWILLCLSCADHESINKILSVEALVSMCGQKKTKSLSSKIFPKIGFKATIVFQTWSFQADKFCFVLSSWTCITPVRNLHVSKISFKQS